MNRFLTSFIMILTLAVSAQAQTFTVINSDPSGNGSLSWAVNSVNALTAADNIISFDSRIKSITLTQELTLNNSVSLYGGGATLEGSGISRHFTVTNGHAQFFGLTFTKGYAVSDNGGAVKIEGSSASAAFTNCTFFNNQADNFGGAVCVTNGAFSPRTTLTHCTLAGNLAKNGGGFAILNGRAELLASVITGNTVSYDVYADSEASIIGDYNVLDTANQNLGSTNLYGCSAPEILFTDSAGSLALESVNGANVLRLSGSSPARDILTQSYGVDTDQTGAVRPMLSGYDAGAFEARPVAVQAIEISGIPYLQVNGTETLTYTITPSDASLNTRDYPPYGIVWRSSNPSVISADNAGNIQAVGVGSSYITAAIYGWDSAGKPANPVPSNALTIYSGTDPRRPVKASIRQIQGISLRSGNYTDIKPLVSLDINGYSIANTQGGTDYYLSAQSSRLDIADAEVVSGDTVRVLAMNSEGSCDITVNAYPWPEGDSGSMTFTVSVSPSATGGNTSTGGSTGNNGVGRSSGGGGCNGGYTFALWITGIFVLYAYIRRNRHA
ncbi:MAG: hypothetical protein IJP54_02485 [Synergistaceae bacterium]|nr:hypothetical protein [Synergistaceae bacterium]